MSLKAVNLTHRYGRREVLSSVNIELEVGATLLLGPNGAGKSTMLEILASVRPHSEGSVLLEGVNQLPSKPAGLRRYRSAVAWLPQATSVYPGVRVQEHVALSGWLKGMSKAEAWSASKQALESVDLVDKSDAPVKALSGGQTRRMGIAGALVHDAQVLLLDEPTASLDPAQRRRFRQLTAALAKERIVVVSSHDTDEAMDTFRQVIVLSRGVVRFSGTPAEFTDGVDPLLSSSERMQIAYENWLEGTI